jgi:cellulose synthase (UDP-forming)
VSNSRLLIVRILTLLVVALGISYLAWRWSSTIAWDAWWIAIPLVLAESYSLGESVLFGVTMWNARRRPDPPPAPPGKTVDVFIATYNEPLEIVLRTAVAARNISYPHSTWILDDGDRPEFAAAAREIDVGYIVRGPDWKGRPRFAKAGNVNNALFQTSGEFVAVLDADQVPDRNFLDRVLGYFDDPEVAFVQTPQQFWNVPRSDPLGSQAELFYGPIQQGKDGWGAAFFCGSNAVLRREALMALGLTMFTRTAAERVRSELRRGRRQLEAMLAVRGTSDTARDGVHRALAALAHAEAQVRTGHVLAEVTYELRRRVREILSAADISPDLVQTLVLVLDRADVARTDHALAIDPINTASITEDMATAMHLHALGWTSVYHHEVLVHGLAPEDVRTMLAQRKRWATGTMQVFFSDNPLFIKGLSLGQRLMYLSTMTSYLNGFAAVIYIVAPITFLMTGVFPIHTDATAFFVYFMPFFLLGQLLFVVAGNRAKGLWRGQQMSFALFPTWISSALAGAGGAFLGKTLRFSVTHKTKQDSGSGLGHVLVQLVAIAALMVAAAVGAVQAYAGDRPQFATAIALIWVLVDIALLWSMVRAARYRGPGDDLPCPIPEDVLGEVDGVVAAITTAGPSAPATAVDTEDPLPEPTPSEPTIAVFNTVAAYRCTTARFDAAAALQLRAAIAGRAQERSLVLIDISEVTTVTPSGVAAMLDLLRAMRSRDGDLRLFGSSRAFTRAHEVLALSHVTRLHISQAAALPGLKVA